MCWILSWYGSFIQVLCTRYNLHFIIRDSFTTLARFWWSLRGWTMLKKNKISKLKLAALSLQYVTINYLVDENCGFDLFRSGFFVFFYLRGFELFWFSSIFITYQSRKSLDSVIEWLRLKKALMMSIAIHALRFWFTANIINWNLLHGHCPCPPCNRQTEWREDNQTERRTLVTQNKEWNVEVEERDQRS